MNLTARRILHAAGAIAVPVAITWLGTAIDYWHDAVQSSLPYFILNVLLAVGAGAAVIVSFPFARYRTLIWTLVVYVPCSIVGVFITGFFTACSFGDCI